MCSSSSQFGSTDSGLDMDMDTERLISDEAIPNWARDFPVIGEGVLIFSIQRSTPFSIIIRPKLEEDEPGADQWISLEVHRDKALFKMHMKGKTTVLAEVTGVICNERVGFDEKRKISYWLSYDRGLLRLKYGKGYYMEESTLLSYSFLTGKKQVDEEIRKQMKYLFSHTIRRRIEQYDIEPSTALVPRYAARVRKLGFRGRSLHEMFPNISSEALDKESVVLAKSIVDIEQLVAFDKDPFVCNWSPLVLDSSKINLFDIDNNKYTLSASLPPACLELCSNITAPNVELDWSAIPEKYKLSDAIRHSLKGPNGTLYKKLKSKSDEFAGFKQTYLRVTLGNNYGTSPGVPYVLEIWPSGHGSPIHNHGNAYAVIKVLYGGLTIKIFNKHVDRPDALPLKTFDVKKGDITWISPNWFQTHQLLNNTNDFCATVQCYQYGANDFTHWPYFDYVASTEVIDEFLPEGDYSFHEMHEIVMKEFKASMENAWTVWYSPSSNSS